MLRNVSGLRVISTEEVPMGNKGYGSATTIRRIGAQDGSSVRFRPAGNTSIIIQCPAHAVVSAHTGKPFPA